MKMIWAIIKFQVEGTHCYPQAEPDVDFLRHEHRHIFHIEVWIQQFHNERDIEYIRTKRLLQSILPESFGNLSCESIAQNIIQYCKERFGEERLMRVKVLEDAENGACIESD